MKLSEAIRLGSALCAQAFEVYQESPYGPRCAIGTAFAAVGVCVYGLTEDEVMGELRQRWPFALDERYQQTVCPSGCDKVTPEDVSGMIIHLNDCHEWTRKQIADWVETVEPAESSPMPAELLETVVARGETQ